MKSQCLVPLSLCLLLIAAVALSTGDEAQNGDTPSATSPAGAEETTIAVDTTAEEASTEPTHSIPETTTADTPPTQETDSSTYPGPTTTAAGPESTTKSAAYKPVIPLSVVLGTLLLFGGAVACMV